MTSNSLLEDSILIKHNRQLYSVLLSEILYIEAKGKLSILHTMDKNLVSNTTLSKFEETLSQSTLFRIHKSYIINTTHLQKIILKDNEVFINDTPLPLGRSYKESFLERFNIF